MIPTNNSLAELNTDSLCVVCFLSIISTSWTELYNAFQSGGDVTLSQDITYSGSNGALVVPSNKTVTLDLNGFTINRNLSTATKKGSVIQVKGILIINDSRGGGQIRGGYVLREEDTYDGGGGLFIYEYGEVIMNGGSICNNKANKKGAGVVISPKAKMTMYGGSISYNQNMDNNSGGGVYIQAKRASVTGIAEFTMYDGEISHNIAGHGAGVYVDGEGSSDIAVFNFHGGRICYNEARAGGNGAGIAVRTYGHLYMYGGYLYKNHADGAGGGIWLQKTSSVEMVITEGTKMGIYENSADVEGDDIESDSGVNLTLISPEQMTKADGEVYFGGKAKWMTDVKGKRFRDGNGSIASKQSGTITNGASLAISIPCPWCDLQDQIDNATDNVSTTITLANDITANLSEHFHFGAHKDCDTRLLVPANKIIVLDLNGYTIDRNLTGKDAMSHGNVFDVASGATLTITDSSRDSANPFGKGVITGANNSNNGGAILNKGTLTVEGGTFIGNKSGNNGGAVYNDANSSMTVAGAAFKNNWTRFHGGAIYVSEKASLTVNAVGDDNTKTLFSGNMAIDNTDEDKGGCGGAICNDGTATITGGEFTNNFGQFGNVYSRGSMTVSGGYFHGDRFHDGKGASPITCTAFTYFKLEGNPVFEDNEVMYGAIQFQCWGSYPSECYVEGGTFRNNRAIGGGALTVRCSKPEDINLKVSGGLFENNTAYYGGVFDIVGGTITVTGGTYRNNKATGGDGNNAEGGVFAVGKGRSNWNYEGTLTVSGGVFEGNHAEFGALAYNHGTMNLSGNPKIGSTQDVYLPAGADAGHKSQYVITKIGDFDAAIPVTLGNEEEGRDVLVSKAGASSSAEGKVVDSDLGKLIATLSDSKYRLIYNTAGRDGDVVPKDVIEIAAVVDMLITKAGLKAGESAAFCVVKKDDSSVRINVLLTGTGSDPVTATIANLLPGEYTVTETDWSWAYEKQEHFELTQDISDTEHGKNVFTFTNTPKDSTPLHSEAMKGNSVVGYEDGGIVVDVKDWEKTESRKIRF